MASRRRVFAAVGEAPQLSGLDPFAAFAEQLGESLGRGIARGINSGLMGGAESSAAGFGEAPRRGRPRKLQYAGGMPADRRCKVDGCTNEIRSKGLCSKHYQAERRRLAKSA